MYHLVLFLNCVIIIKATITWVRTTVFPSSVNLSRFLLFKKKIIF